MIQRYFDIYTDGSCINNPGPGGWGAILLEGEAVLRLSGQELETTNNRMELTAAIKGIAAVPSNAVATVYTDSKYLVNTMTKGWKRNTNKDLWNQLDSLCAIRNVHWTWVHGHSGNHWNEEADKLANIAAMRSAQTEAGPTLSHIDSTGAARMVNVGDKPPTDRFAKAEGSVVMRPETLDLIMRGKMEKGDVFTVSRLAGIAAAKRTWDLIPLAHQIPLTHIDVEFQSDLAAGSITITSTVRTTAQTGVEMEALVAASISALTLYDMCKAVDRGITLLNLKLLEKWGGKSGSFQADRSSV